MLEATVHANQPFRNLESINAQPLNTIIQEFNREIQYLQARLASQLSFNSFLVEKAHQLPQTVVRTIYPQLESNTFSKTWMTQEGQLTKVKRQEFGPPAYLDQKYFLQNIKQNNQKEKQMLSEKDRQKSKKDINSELKIEQKCQFQLGQVAEKNQTKNIPKNYGKAMLSFIQRNIDRYTHVVKPILHKQKLTINDLLVHIKKHKKEVNSIHYLKLMWGHQNTSDPIFKCIRILSHIFMRKYCLYYIFNSRIKNYNTHIKYRKRMLEGIENPAQFTCIKQF